MKIMRMGWVLWIMVLTMGKLHAQKKLVKIWETDSILKVPESVYHDEKNNVLYVTNIEGSGPWDADGKGSVSKLSPSGKLINLNWITGLNAPKGMGIYNGKLYIADITNLVIVDIKKGRVVDKIPVKGSERLNDITVGDGGVIYISDSKARRVYKYANGKCNILLDSNILNGPNGLLWHHKNLYILDAGAMLKMLSGKGVKKIASGMDCGTDGLVNIGGDDFIASCWLGSIYYINEKTGHKQHLIDTRENKLNTADIGYNRKKNILYVPTFWRNTVMAFAIERE